MNINPQLFLYLFFSFILATIVGTLSHELGHYLVAEWLGYDAEIHYAAMGIIDSTHVTDTGASDGFWITFGGPPQTMLTGSIGLLFLFLYRHRFHDSSKLAYWQWCLVFISLFWLRQPANLVTRLGAWIFYGHLSSRGDEIRLAQYLHMPEWSILISTAVLGMMVLAIVYFLFIPQKQRTTFLLAGLSGGIAGYVLWLKIVGKLILP